MVGMGAALLVFALASLGRGRRGGEERAEGIRAERPSRARRPGPAGSPSQSSTLLARGFFLAVGLSVGLPLVPLLPARTGAALAALAAGLYPAFALILGRVHGMMRRAEEAP